MTRKVRRARDPRKFKARCNMDWAIARMVHSGWVMVGSMYKESLKENEKGGTGNKSATTCVRPY